MVINMGKKKQLKLDIPKLTAKETLIGYVGTLTEKQAKEAYQMLLERFSSKRARIIKFNRNGVQDTGINGKVRLTPREYERLIEERGELYFHRVVEILYDYICYLEDRGESEAPIRRRLKEYQRISHYYKLTKGWVAERYQEELNQVNQSKVASSAYNNSLSVWDIETLEQAQKFIDELPSELKINNPEVEYLMARFPNLLLR